MTPYGVIYKITDKENGKVYIGQTTDYYRRIQDYKYTNSKIKCYGYGNCNRITQEFYNKGFENFEFCILDEGNSPQELVILERYWIKQYNSMEEGYNDQHPVIKYKMQDSAKQKLREKALLFKHTSETRLSKSKPIITYNPTTGTFKRYSSSKVFGDCFNTHRGKAGSVNRNCKQIYGLWIFYCDKNEREKIYRNSSDKNYRKLYESIEKDLETIEKGKMNIDII